MQPTALKTVEINKEGRFWAVRADGELLAMVLYKNGAQAVQRRLQQLAGLPVEGEEAKELPKGKFGKAAKKGEKPNGKVKSTGKKSAKVAEVPDTVTATTTTV